MEKILTRLKDLTQTSLLDSIPVDQKKVGANGTDFSDPSFAINKESPVHRWVPWIAGFSCDFVSDAIGRHLKNAGNVLDPFAGVGTTLVEAVFSGHNAIGFEINPYAALACKVKVNAFKVSPQALGAEIASCRDFYFLKSEAGYTPESVSPKGFTTRTAFYGPTILRKVLILQDFIRHQPAGLMRDFFRLAFAATMITYSNYSYEPSLSRRTTAGKKEFSDFPVGEAFLAKLRQMLDDVEWMKLRLNGSRPVTKILNESFFGCKQRLPGSSIDLIITSPPYLNNYHYNRNTRPHLYWLGFAECPNDFQKLENDNFGKYWQTVRESSRVDLDFPSPSSELLECLENIRHRNPEKGVYGGFGWANYAATYFNDCYKFAMAAKWILRRRGTALIVIGNNIIQGMMVPTDRFLAEIAQSAGLELVEIHIPRATRVGSSIIQSSVRVGTADASHNLYEAVVELRKR